MSTIIATGTVVVAPQYSDRATVRMDTNGSVLTIGIANFDDAGEYICSVAVEGKRPELKHTVVVRGEAFNIQNNQRMRYIIE